MKKSCFLLILLFYKISLLSGQPYWQQQVNYTIDVSLNDNNHTLDGFVKMEYINNAPDTLYFIWFHLWPNAFKNDRTAFSDQLLQNGPTDFYFSKPEQRGYINRLDFKVNNTVANTEDHPLHQDIVKLLLPEPLPPGGVIKIQTPFHVQLPFNFSRGGHVGQSYQATQWYPKPAVYDRKGWHPMPYLDQGEFYSEFGNYEVQVTLPKNYLVAATGILQDESEKTWLREKAAKNLVYEDAPVKRPAKNKQPGEEDIDFPASAKELKTIRFKQDSVHDFAWFADKRFATLQDTLKLSSGKIILVAAFFPNLPERNHVWKNSIAILKRSILTRSAWLGEYPYATVTALEAGMGFPGGMEYPTITSISPFDNEQGLEGVIEHEVGHNWNYGALASNERAHPWMDEGINSYYGDRYRRSGSNVIKKQTVPGQFFYKRLPSDLSAVGLRMMTTIKKDQPIETVSENFSAFNYGLIAYYKSSQWMLKLEQTLGTPMFDSCMRIFYHRWKNKHPYPEDLKHVMEDVSGTNLDAEYALLSKKGNLDTTQQKRDTRLSAFFNLKDTDKHRYISIAPAIGYNHYDKFMIGGLLHNYTLPAEKFQFLVAPVFATGSKQLNGLGRARYQWYPGSDGQKIEIALTAATFSGNAFTDSVNNTTFFRFSKLAPSIKFVFGNKDPRSHVTKFLQWKTFLIREQGLRFSRDPVTGQDVITYPFANRYVNQLRFVWENNRVLYPYRTEARLEQGDGFARLAVTGNYYFNYAKGGGMNLRFFAGKFFYLSDKTYLKQFETDRYHLNMSGPKGYEDYTYENYFIGRNEFEKYASQQIMERDGFFKVRTDLLSSKTGKTDDWLAAANFTTDIPEAVNPLQVLPVKIPLKIFLDIGTYAEAWKTNSGNGRLLYDAGLQLSLFANTVNIYFPLVYSKVYRDYFKSTITEKRFLRNISFSIDLQNITMKKLAPQIPL